jgi:O-acetyl-ADP-ribose deacetylase (regulator of RNase III)
MVVAADNGFRSIAFPLIGAGSGGYNHQRAKQIMFDELAKVDSSIDVLIVEFKKNA